MTTQAKFSMFEARLSPEAFSCFRVLFENVRDLIAAGKKPERYEIPVALFLEKSGAGDVEQVAEAIKAIIECKIDVKKGDYLYFYSFFDTVCIEKGVVKYTVPADVEHFIPTAHFTATA